MIFTPSGMLKKMMWAPAIVGIFLLYACGSSSDDVNNINTDTNSTTVSGKVMAGGYWADATVCLDTTLDDACLDETKYITETDATGSYELYMVLDEDLAQYSIIVEATDKTYDAGDGTDDPVKVETDQKMTAPGLLALINESNQVHISPLVSIIAYDAKQNDIYFGVLYKDALESLGLDTSINLSAVDYIEFLGDGVAFEALKLFNEYLFENPNYNDIFEEGTAGEGYTNYRSVVDKDYLETVKNETESELGEPLSSAVDLSKLKSKAGSGVEETSYYDVPDLPSQVDTVHPGEYQNKIDEADFSNTIREIAISAVYLIPKVGLFAGLLLDCAWPEDAPAVLGLLYKDVSTIIQNQLNDYAKNTYGTELGVLRGYVEKYVNQNLGEDSRKEFFRKAFDSSEKLMIRFKEDQAYNYKVLPLAVMALNIHMVLHLERLKNYDALYPEGVSVSKDSVLKEFVDEYKIYRNTFLVGDQALYKKYLNYRESNIEAKSERTGGFLQFTYCNGIVEDKLTSYRIHYMMSRDACNDGDPNYYLQSVSNVKARIMAEARLAVAKVVSSVLLLPRFMPEGSLTSADVISQTELTGPTSAYYTPDDLKNIQLGPISRSCLVYYGYDIKKDGIRGQATCNQQINSYDPAATFESPITSTTAYAYGGQLQGLSFTSVEGETKDLGRLFKGIGSLIVEVKPPAADSSLIGFDAIKFERGGENQRTWGYLKDLQPHYARVSADGTKVLNFAKPMTGYSGNEINHTALGSTDFKLSKIVISKNNQLSPQSKAIDYMWLTFSFYPEQNTKVK